MSNRNRVRSRVKTRPSAKAQPQKSNGGFVEFPYAAYPNHEAFAYSYLYGGTAGDVDLTHDDWSRAQAYQLVGIVNRCIDIVAQTTNSIPWNIVRRRDGKKEIVSTSEEYRPSHPFAAAINNVYREQGLPFMALVSYSRLQYGETYIEKRQNPGGFQRSLKWLNPYWTEPDTTSGYIKGFWYGAKANGMERSYALLPTIAYEHTYNPLDDLRGYSKLDAALSDINISRQMKRFIKWTLANNARPGLILSPQPDAGSPIPSQLLDKDMELLEKKMEDSHVGTQNASTALISPKPLNVTTLEGPELDKYRYTTEAATKAICVVFGVPLSMAGDSSSTNYKDGEDVYDDAFINNTIIPNARMTQDFCNVQLMPFFDDSGECTLEIDLSAYRDTTAADRARTDLITIQQDKGLLTLADSQRAQGLPVYPEYEGKVMINGVITPLAQIATQPASPQVSVTAPDVPQLPASSTPPPETNDATKDAAGTSIVLSFANNVDLISLQRDLQVKYAAQAIRWNTPDSFHITLVSAPMVDEAVLEQLVDQIAAYPPPELQVNIGSLTSFDSLKEHALHFRIRRNADLYAYQAEIYALCQELGIQMGQYSTPQNWTPHITMGYAAERIPSVTFQSRLRVAPSEVQVSVKRDGQYEVVGQIPCGEDLPTKSAHTHPPYVFEKALPPAEWREKALKELINWQRLSKAGESFIPVYARGKLANDITRGLSENFGMPREDHIKSVFDNAFMVARYEPFKATLARLERAFNKDIGETRQEFEDEFLIAIADAKDGAITTNQLSSILHSVVDNLGEQAYMDGLEDGGVQNADLDDDDRATIAALKSEASGYIDAFVANFKTLSDVQLDQKPGLWSRKTLQTFYDRGLAAADANGIYVWKLGQTEDHCDDCLRLNGTRQRMKNWLKNGLLPQSDKLACKGFNCDCRLENIRGGAKG